MPAPLIPIALALAQMAPSLLRYFGVGESSVGVAEKVIDIAAIATGTKNPEEMVAVLKNNQEALLKFQTLVLEKDSELEKAYLSDRQDARKRDASFLAAGTRNYRADAMVGSAYIIVALIVVGIWNNTEMSEFMKSTLTLLLGRLLGYIDQAFQFEFGTTRTSRTKDDTISNLSGRNS